MLASMASVSGNEVSRKGWIAGLIWFCFSIVLILLLSVQDKEWLIDGKNIKNICDLKAYVESEDIRDAGIAITIPLFFPFVYLLVWKKQHHGFLYLTLFSIFAFWLWRFFLRYQFCL